MISAFVTACEIRKPALEVHRGKRSCFNVSRVRLSCQTSLLYDGGLIMLTFGPSFAPAIACHLVLSAPRRPLLCDRCLKSLC